MGPTSSSPVYARQVPHDHVLLQAKFKWLPCGLHVRLKNVYFLSISLTPQLHPNGAHFFKCRLCTLYSTITLYLSRPHLSDYLVVFMLDEKNVYFFSGFFDTIGAPKGAHFFNCRFCTLCSTMTLYLSRPHLIDYRLVFMLKKIFFILNIYL